jgi:glycosyltransferase involved in cell wall biosynthesis
MISIVMPLDGYGDWARQSINSCMRDPERLEIVLVLSKKTSSKIGDIKNEFPSIEGKSFKFLVQDGIGLADALNEGVIAASYELVARLDSDDLLATGRLTLQKEFLLSNPSYVAVGGQVELIDSLGNTIRRIHRPASDLAVRKQIVFGNCFTHSAVMFRKTIFTSVGGYDADCDAEDFDLWSRMITVGKVTNLKQLACFSRMHEAQISSVNSLKVSKSNFQIIRKNVLFLDYRMANLSWSQLPLRTRFSVSTKSLAFFNISESRKSNRSSLREQTKVGFRLVFALILWPPSLFRYISARHGKV